MSVYSAILQSLSVATPKKPSAGHLPGWPGGRPSQPHVLNGGDRRDYGRGRKNGHGKTSARNDDTPHRMSRNTHARGGNGGRNRNARDSRNPGKDSRRTARSSHRTGRDTHRTGKNSSRSGSQWRRRHHTGWHTHHRKTGRRPAEGHCTQGGFFVSWCELRRGV